MHDCPMALPLIETDTTMAHHHPPSRHSMLDGVDLRKPLHKGYVYKQSHLHLAFNKRFCVLYPRVMAYYEHEEDFRKDAARQTLEVGPGGSRE